MHLIHVTMSHVLYQLNYLASAIKPLTILSHSSPLNDLCPQRSTSQVHSLVGVNLSVSEVGQDTKCNWMGEKNDGPDQDLNLDPLNLVRCSTC